MRGSTMGEINTIFISEHFQIVLEKVKVQLLPSRMSKITFKFLKSWNVLFLDKAHQKLDIFALNLQYFLSLQDFGQDKTK